MADLGCNAWDGTHDPPTGEECPESCTPTCCDTAPQDKYVTATANFNSLNPSVTGDRDAVVTLLVGDADTNGIVDTDDKTVICEA